MIAAMSVTILLEAEIEVVDRGGGVVSVPLVTPETVPGAGIVTGMSEYPKGTGAPRHVHNCAEQVTLLAGVGEVEVDGKVTALQPNDSTFIPANVEHAFRNTGDRPMRILWIYVADHVTRTFTDTGETVAHLSTSDLVS
jgi:quercetin dioxygenase-like cupin family protein